MSVQAKFFVSAVNHMKTPGSDPVAEVTMQPVFGSYGDGKGEENKEWSKYTPSGEIKMTITNPDAIKQFVPGEAYYVEFSPAL